MTVVKQVYFCQSEELKKKKTIYIEEKERKHVDTENTIVRERTRREEERKYVEVQSVVLYRQEPPLN